MDFDGNCRYRFLLDANYPPHQSEVERHLSLVFQGPCSDDLDVGSGRKRVIGGQ